MRAMRARKCCENGVFFHASRGRFRGKFRKQNLKLWGLILEHWKEHRVIILWIVERESHASEEEFVKNKRFMLSEENFTK